MASANVGELQIALKFDTKELDKSQKEVESGASRMGQAMQTAFGVLAADAIQTVVGKVSEFAKSIINTGMGFDTAMSQVAATMGKTTDQIGSLRDAAIEMGSSTKYTATEAAQGLNILAMAGLNAEEQIAGIPVVLDLASAGAMSLENAASYVVGAVNGFSDTMDNAQYYADLMAKGATLANTSVSGLGEAFSRSAATASSYGQQADSVTVALLRLASQNVTGEAAATAMNRAMADLYTPTKDAATALNELGISAYDSAGSARDFNVVADEIAAALSNMSDEEANAYASTIFTTEGLNAFNKMTAISTDKVDEFRDGIKNAFGAAAQQAGVQIDNLEGNLTLLNSKFDGIKIQIYEGLKPALNAGIEILSGLGDAIIWVMNNSNWLIPVLGGLGAAFVAYQLAVNGASIVMGIATAATNIMTIAQGALNAVMMLNPIGLVVAAIVGLIAVIGLLWANCEEFRNFIMGVFENIGQFLASAGEAVGQFFSTIGQWFAELPGNIATWVGEALNNVGTWVGDMVNKAIELGTQFLASIGEFFSQLPYNLGKFLTTALLTVAKFVVDMIAKAIEVGTQFLQNIVNFFTQLPGKIQEFITAAFNNVVNWAVQMTNKAQEAGSRFLQNVVNFIQQLPSKIWGLLTNVIGKVASFVGDFVNKAREAGQNFFNTIVDEVGKIPGKMISIGGDIVRGIWNGISGAAGWIKDQIAGFCSGVVDGIKEFFGIHSPSTLFRDEVGKYMAEGIGVGFSEEMENVSEEMAKSIELPEMSVESYGSWTEAVIGLSSDDNTSEPVEASSDLKITQYNTIENGFDVEQMNQAMLAAMRGV